jgi:hypothetical protein
MDILFLGLSIALVGVTALAGWGCERLRARLGGGRP